MKIDQENASAPSHVHGEKALVTRLHDAGLNRTSSSKKRGRPPTVVKLGLSLPDEPQAGMNVTPAISPQIEEFFLERDPTYAQFKYVTRTLQAGRFKLEQLGRATRAPEGDRIVAATSAAPSRGERHGCS